MAPDGGTLVCLMQVTKDAVCPRGSQSTCHTGLVPVTDPRGEDRNLTLEGVVPRPAPCTCRPASLILLGNGRAWASSVPPHHPPFSSLSREPGGTLCLWTLGHRVTLRTCLRELDLCTCRPTSPILPPVKPPSLFSPTMCQTVRRSDPDADTVSPAVLPSTWRLGQFART